jgi:hypothetical protein
MRDWRLGLGIRADVPSLHVSLLSLPFDGLSRGGHELPLGISNAMIEDD